MVKTRSGDPATLAVELNDIDTEKLSSLLPDIELAILTPNAALTLYKLILTQAEESLQATEEIEELRTALDESRAENEKKDVELDQAYQDRDSSTREFETRIAQVNVELENVKRLLDASKSESEKLKRQLGDVSNAQSGSKEEMDTLRQRCDDSEREKRDLIGVVSRLQDDTVQREEEVQTLRSNLKQARQEHAALETQVRDIRSNETSTKFKLDTLQQQLALSQSSNERLSTDLSTAQTSLTTLRRSKQAEISTLQASFDELSSAQSATTQTLNALRAQHTKQSGELSQALGRIQDLQGRLAEQEAGYSNEAANLRRLVDAMEDRERQTKEEVEAIEKEWATLGERSERKEAALRSEIDRERRAREEAEHRVERLNALLEKINDPLAELSPTVALASKSQRTGKTFTEVYGDYVRLQEDFARKSAEYDHMDRTLSAVLAQIEERAPLLSQQRAEYERLQSESSQLASQLTQAIADRDIHLSYSKDASHKLNLANRENELLQHQLTDLGRQVQHLLSEIARHDDPSLPPLADDDPITEAQDIDSVITNNLVLFHSLGSLQSQNQKLLKITRELGSKLEREERDYEGRMEAEQAEAIREAHEAMQSLAMQLDSQKKSAEMRIAAYAKETEVLRSRLERATVAASHAPDETELRGVGGMKEEEYVEMQTRFEAYRNETTFDATRLREELLEAQRSNAHVTTSLAKANAKIEYLLERQRHVTDQYNMQTQEMEGLSKRNTKLFEDTTRANMEYNRVAEDLVVANNRVEQLRNECSNLKAERSIWESSHDRLVAENKALAKERAHLGDLMGNVQKMHNDLERSGEGDKRRLEGQVQMMENQIQDLKNQLTQERESVRHVTLQKDIEVKELHARLDTTIADFARTRELLVGAETTRTHLQEKVSDLSKHYQGMEEKLAVYERRSNLGGIIASHSHEVNPNLSGEQQLEAEVADLRSALKVAEVDLANARSHVQQFQEISQANEAALSRLSTSFDEYKIATEAQVTRLESDLSALQNTTQAVQTENSKFTERYNSLQSTLDAERSAWQADRRTLEGTIVDMSTSEKDSEGDRILREQEAATQQQRAAAAEDRYSREVLAHAESIKTIEILRTQLSDAQAHIRNDRSAVETAQAKLSTSESSWRHQREILDKEITELTARCKDLSDQNSILHQHLESVSSQAARIRNAADSSHSTADTEGTSENTDTKLTELRSVVAYLRKEKEIVDLQLELSKQENIRLKSHIDHLTKNLDDARTSLAQERERATESAGSDAQHKELVERINQLNILRESNSTLRADCNNHAKRARELETQLKQVSAEIEPSREAARVAQAELGARDARILRLEEESKRWQDRNAQLLSKYDRIDPADVQLLKDEIETLKTQKVAADESVQEYITQNAAQAKRLEALEANVISYKSTLQRNNEGARAKIASLNADIATLREQVKTLSVDRDALQGGAISASEASSALEKLQTDMERLRSENATLEATLRSERATKVASSAISPEQAAEQEIRVAALTAERDQLAAEKSSWMSLASGSTDGSDIAVAEKLQLVKERDDAVARANASTAQAQKAEMAARNLKMAYEKSQQRLADVSKSRASDSERAAASQAAAVTTALEQQRAELQASGSGDPAARNAATSAELEALRLSLEAKYQEDLLKAIDNAKEEERKSIALNGTTNSDPASGDQEAAIAAAIKAHDEALKAQHAEELTKAMDSGRKELGMKIKLKDQALVRAQSRVKELEGQIIEWKKQKMIPESPAPTPATTAAKPVTTPSAPPGNAASAGASTSIPPSNGAPVVATPGAAPVRGAPRGTARGGAVRARGGVPTRGAAPGRGAAPTRGGAPQTAAVTTPATPTLSIMGAASKRPRDEGEDATLAKRLKPAESAGKPVAIRRPPAPPS